MTRRRGGTARWASVLLLACAGGCASTGIRAEVAYFPAPPASPRVVHLISFSRLSDVAPARVSWSEFLRGVAPSPHIGTPAGIAWRDGHLYICDTTANGVHDWDLSSGRARLVGVSGEVVLGKPVDVAVDERGVLFVADTERGEVVGFAPDGSEVRRFRRDGSEGYRPAGVAVGGEELFVADIGAHRIDVFSAEGGELLRTIGSVGSEPGQFYFPMGLAIGEGGRLLVADMFNGRVQELDAAGRPALSMGQPGDRYGDMGKPKRVAVGPDGTILVADPEFSHVHLFDARGRLLMLVGGPERRTGGTPMPVGVAVAESMPPRLAALVPSGFRATYYMFVANSRGERRISLYAVGGSR